MFSSVGCSFSVRFWNFRKFHLLNNTHSTQSHSSYTNANITADYVLFVFNPVFTIVFFIWFDWSQWCVASIMSKRQHAILSIVFIHVAILVDRSIFLFYLNQEFIFRWLTENIWNENATKRKWHTYTYLPHLLCLKTHACIHFRFEWWNGLHALRLRIWSEYWT